MKLLKYEVLNQIKENIEYYKEFFLEDNYYQKLMHEFSMNYYEDFEIPSLLIEFDMSVIKMRDRKDTDFNNAIKIYETYEFLSESQASDERFWCGIGIEPLNMEYLFYRWGETKNTIKYRLTYHASGKRGMLYHGLARLWWFTHLTVQNSEDRYELTRFAFQHPHILEKMIYRNFSNSRNVRISIIKAIKKFIEEDGKYSTQKIDELYKYVSVLSGNKLLDIIPEEVLINQFKEFLLSI